MKKINTLLNSTLIALVFCLSQQTIAAPITHAAIDANDQEIILKDINTYRSKNGLPPLTMNKLISKEAENHSHNMATNQIPFSHDGFKNRMQQLFACFKQANAIAENIAYVYTDTKSVVNVWINSPGHRKNIEGNYNLTGIGIAHSKDGKIFVTQIFLHNEPEHAASVR